MWSHTFKGSGSGSKDGRFVIIMYWLGTLYILSLQHFTNIFNVYVIVVYQLAPAVTCYANLL